MTLSSYIQLEVKISWDNSGLFTGTYDDVSAYVRNLSVKRGRQKVDDVFGAGQGQFTLRNQEGRFSPFNIASPISGQVLPGRPVRVRVIYGGVTYAIFKGTCSPKSQTIKLSDASVDFDMIDAFEKFRLKLTNTPLATGQRTGTLMNTVLDDIGWPTAERRIDLGQHTLSYFTNHNRLAINAMQLIAHEEATGYVFMGPDGYVVFQDSANRASQLVIADINEMFDDLSLELRQEDMVDRVRVEYHRISVATSLGPVYELSPSFLRLPPGNTTFEGKFTGQGASSSIAPVAVTDYTANSASDGTGTDVTAQVTVVSWTQTSSGGFTVTFNNANASNAYLSMVARGYSIMEGTEKNVVSVTVAAPIVTGQNLNEEFTFQDSSAVLTAWANWQASIRGNVRVRPELTITPATDALVAFVLGVDVGNRITLTDNAAVWLSGLVGDYHVEGIGIEFEGGNAVPVVSLSLLDREILFGSMFRVTSDEDAIARGLAGSFPGSIILSDVDAGARGLAIIDSPFDRIGV